METPEAQPGGMGFFPRITSVSSNHSSRLNTLAPIVATAGVTEGFYAQHRRRFGGKEQEEQLLEGSYGVPASCSTASLQMRGVETGATGTTTATSSCNGSEQEETLAGVRPSTSSSGELVSSASVASSAFPCCTLGHYAKSERPLSGPPSKTFPPGEDTATQGTCPKRDLREPLARYASRTAPSLTLPWMDSRLPASAAVTTAASDSPELWASGDGGRSPASLGAFSSTLGVGEPTSFLRARLHALQRRRQSGTRLQEQPAAPNCSATSGSAGFLRSASVERLRNVEGSTIDATAGGTRSKLSALQSKIQQFEGQLQAESQHRRAAEEERLGVLRAAVAGLEATLGAEATRRLEAHKAIQTTFEAQLGSLGSHLDDALSARTAQVQDALGALTTRLQTAEQQLSALREAQTTRCACLTEEARQATEDITAIKDHLESELKARRQREAVILDRLSEVEKQIDSRLSLERGIRHKDVEALRASLDAVHTNHVALDESFQQSLASEFHALKAFLQAETQAREQADDDIVQALNHYTAALQSALRIANCA